MKLTTFKEFYDIFSFTFIPTHGFKSSDPKASTTILKITAIGEWEKYPSFNANGQKMAALLMYV